MPDNRVSRSEVLIVRIVMASSSSAKGSIWHVGVFQEEFRGKESKVQFVLQGAGLPWRDYELAWPFIESASTALQKKTETSAKAKQGALTSFFEIMFSRGH